MCVCVRVCARVCVWCQFEDLGQHTPWEGPEQRKSSPTTQSNWEASTPSEDQVLFVGHSRVAHVASYKILVHLNDMKW